MNFFELILFVSSVSNYRKDVTCLTCSQVVESCPRLHPVADSLDGNRVVPAWLKLVDREPGLLDRNTGAVSVKSCQFIVFNLELNLELNQGALAYTI